MTEQALVERIKKIVSLGDTMKVSEIARRLRVKREEIENVCQSHYGLDLLVAVAAGGGVVDYKPSQYEVEHFE